MRTKGRLWLWQGLWGLSLLIGLGVFALYARLPADGVTGDLESFTPQGFRVQWLLEEREGGLRVGDVIIRAGGHTVNEWLEGAPRGSEWRTGGIVSYQVLRNEQPTTLQIQLSPIPFRAILLRWGPQFVVALAFLFIGTLVLWKRPYQLAARLLTLFCITMTLQYWGDAYNFQYATLPWRWPLWLHLIYEHGMYSFSIATICFFALIFPIPNPLVERYPRLVPLILYISGPLAIVAAMALSPGWSTALETGNHASWVIAMLQIGLAIGAGLHSTRAARDPVSRAQIRWILWCASVGVAVLFPSYALPLMLGIRPLLPHPVTMIFIALIPFALAVAILRYRLFDIEVIINRTLVYGTLTVLLGTIYLLLVPLLTLLIRDVFHQENDSLAVFIAMLCIAFVFTPLRQRVQTVIDFTFYRTKLDYQRLLPEMSERLATSIVLDQLAQLLTADLPRRLQIAWATLAVLDPEGEHFILVNGGNDQLTLAVDHPLAEHLRRAGRPLLRLQPPPDLPPQVQTFLDRHGIEFSIPLVVGTELVGLYNLGPKLSGDAYNRDEGRLLYLLGQQAAIAVENSRLFQAEREQRQLAEALDQAAALVSSTLDLDRVLDHILEQVERVVEGDAFNVMLIEDDHVRVVRWRGYERLGVAGKMEDKPFPISRFSILAKLMQTGEPILIPDTATDPDWVPLKGWEWLQSYVSAPIRVAGEVVGALNVDGSRPGQFGPADARRLEAFTHHAATALENARLYDKAQQEIAERKRAEEQIKASLKEKEVLLKEVHHRVKNNLQVISSLLYLQSKDIENAWVFDIFQDSQSRIRSMALVHEKLYQSQDLGRIDFAEYVQSLANYLYRSYDTSSHLVDLNVNIDRVYLSIDTALPCGLIVNELISNSLRHAFPEGQKGQIWVELRLQHDGQYTLAVSDNGVGLPEDLDFQNTRSLGLQLVNSLVDQLEGTIELDRSTGVAFKITFTDPAYEAEE